MKVNILVMYDKRLGAYGQPHFTDKEPEIEAKELARGLAIATDDVRSKYVGKELYLLGTFEDEKGTLIPLDRPEILLACDEVAYVGREEKLN